MKFQIDVVYDKSIGKHKGTSSDIPGLFLMTNTFEEMVEEIGLHAPDLIQDNLKIPFTDQIHFDIEYTEEPLQYKEKTFKSPYSKCTCSAKKELALA